MTSTMTMTTMGGTTTAQAGAPDVCPTCGAGELLFTAKRRQFRCGGAAVLLGAATWSQNWPCILPQKREDAGDLAALRTQEPAPLAPALPVVGPVASLEVVEGTPAEPRRVRIAFVGGIGDWHDMHAWSRTSRTAEDYIHGTLKQTGRPALPMAGVGAAA